MTPEAIPVHPTDPLLDMGAGRVAPRISLALHHLMTARRLGVFTIIMPAPRVSVGAEGRRRNWVPGAVVPVSEPWFNVWSHGLRYRSDHPTEARPHPGTYWKAARYMPRRAVREAVLILTHERRPAPAGWVDDATALAAGIVPVVLRLDSGRRASRYCMADTALHEAEPDVSLLKASARAAFVEDYARRYGLGPARLRACDVWKVRTMPFTYYPETPS